MNHYCNLHSYNEFVQTRIDLIRRELDASDQRSADLSIIMNYILFGSKVQTKAPVSLALEEMHNLCSEWDIINNGDFAGFLYQSLSQKIEKKKKGQFFTPSKIVDHIVSDAFSNTSEVESLRVLDPSCGSGQFLIALFKKLVSLYEAMGIPYHEAAYLIVTKNLFGSDID